MTLRLLALVSIILISENIHARNISAVLRITGDTTSRNDSSQYFVPDRVIPTAGNSSQQNLELSGQKKGFNATATLRNRARQQARSRQRSFFNELYLDKQLARQDISIGRKIISWGVGFGFRPLDVIQQEDRRQLYRNTLKGIDLLTLEKFAETSALSIVWSNPGRGEQRDSHHEESLALKYYQSLETADFHALARYSQRTRLQVGFGISRVPSDSVEWHASLLWQQDYRQRLNRLTFPGAQTLLAQDNPFVEQRQHHGIQALAGLGWTHASGWGLLGEAWFDETAYSRAQWHALNALTQQQRKLLDSALANPAAVTGNIAFNRQAFQQNNLLQWNTLLRISRQGQSFEPSLELLYTPNDRGWVATAKASYKLDWQQVEAGWRRFGGADAATWRQLPDDGQLFLSWQGSF